MNVMDEVESGGGKQVIARAAAVLRALESQPQGLSLSQLAKASNLPRTTVHRIVAALEAQQLVVSGPGGVRLGPALVRLAASAHADVLAIARPSIELLGRRTRETVDLCVYRGMHSISVDQYPSDHELRVVSPVGTAFPIHCTAHGKALLSELTDEAIRNALPATLEKRTGASLDQLDALLQQLTLVRENRLAIDIEEHAPGVCGLGVALETGTQERYALAVAIPALRFPAARDMVQSALLQCKAEIEAALGMAGQRVEAAVRKRAPKQA
jgi:IclR family acetate operon transcriptional repressor